MKVLSGIQPTGRFHWGNYFGAIQQYIALQNNDLTRGGKATIRVTAAASPTLTIYD